MKRSDARQLIRPLAVAIASAAALVTAGCGDKPSTSSQSPQQPADTASSRVERAAESAEQKLERAAEAVGQRLEGTGKVVEDASVTAKVKAILVADPNLKARSIDVDTTGGVVTLKGTTENVEQKQLAEQLATAVEGVRSVRNELVVIKG